LGTGAMNRDGPFSGGAALRGRGTPSGACGVSSPRGALFNGNGRSQVVRRDAAQELLSPPTGGTSLKREAFGTAPWSFT
jgi:hypothetical protein